MHTIEQLSALAQETRFNVFRALMRAGPDGMSAGAISQALDVAPNTLSSHLSVLHRAGLADVRRDGKSLFYSANIEGVKSLIGALVRDCCDGHPEVCEALAEPARSMRET